MSQNKDQATRDREAAEEFCPPNFAQFTSGIKGIRECFLAGKLHERQNPSDEVRELIVALKFINEGRNKKCLLEGCTCLSDTAFFALQKFQATTKGDGK